MPRFSPKLAALLLASLPPLLAYMWWGEPGRLHVTEHVVKDPDGPLAHPIRVLLLTDWHLGRWTRPRSLAAKMRRLVARHQKRPFDAVLLGGDFIDTDQRYLHRLSPMLRGLWEWGVPLLAVPGNHDYTTFGGDFGSVRAFLEAHGVHILHNASAVITAGGQSLLVVGLDDLQEEPAYYAPGDYKTPVQYAAAARKIDWYSRFDDAAPDLPRIVLSHNPDAVYLPGRRPLAVLSGHTHGGQIMLLDWVSRPLHRWLHPHLPPGSMVTWAGRKKIEGRTLIVSRGMDGSSLPVRLLRPPEAVAVTFR